MEEAEDKKPAAVQRVEPNEVNTPEDVEEAEEKKPTAKHRATLQQKTRLQGQKLFTQEAILFAEKEGKINEVLDENQSQQWGGTGTNAQDAIIINSQSPIADKKGSHHWLHERGKCLPCC